MSVAAQEIPIHITDTAFSTKSEGFLSEIPTNTAPHAKITTQNFDTRASVKCLNASNYLYARAQNDVVRYVVVEPVCMPTLAHIGVRTGGRGGGSGIPLISEGGRRILPHALPM